MTWDEHAASWDEDEAVRAYSRAAFRCLQRLHDDARVNLDGACVLDFGCGTGLLTEQLTLQAERIVALDTSAAMIQVLAAKVNQRGWSNVAAVAASVDSAQQQRPDLFSLPFDIVVSSSVCAFLDDYAGTVASVTGLLKPGGSFVQWDWELNAEDGEPVGLTRAQVIDALTRAGLLDIVVETAFEIEVDGERMSPLIGVGSTAR